MKNPLLMLQEYGQSVWLDYLHRSLIASGELQRFVEEDGVRGLTSNPCIIKRAIEGGRDYRDIIEAPESQVIDAKTLYERISVRDIQEAADVLHPVYQESKRRDGYVSLEVSPRLARETRCTVEEARRLWRTVDRENLMIKVPGTPEGMHAVEQLIGEGINVNVTLLFAQETYEQAATAYIGGLESFAGRGGDLGKVAGVASFFVSRIDTAVDNWIAERLKVSKSPEEIDLLRTLPGKVANACAKNAYRKYLEILRGDRWQQLHLKGAQSQRLVWASTGTNNRNYSDVLYVEELIGPDTVNTMPPATLDAFRDHGRVRPSLTEHMEDMMGIMETVKQVGIPFKELTDTLLDEGVKQFSDAFDKLLKALDHKGEGFDHDHTDYLKIKMLEDLYKGQHYA